MSGPLAGRTIALAEGRQLEELAEMLEKEGATALRCPMVSILDAPDPAPVLAWLRELIAPMSPGKPENFFSKRVRRVLLATL